MSGCAKKQLLLQNVGAGDVDQVEEDVHKLAWNILLNSKHKRKRVQIFTAVQKKATTKKRFSETMQHNQGSQTGTSITVQTETTLHHTIPK